MQLPLLSSIKRIHHYETLGFIKAVSVFTKYTGKTIDEINFCSI